MAVKASSGVRPEAPVSPNDLVRPEGSDRKFLAGQFRGKTFWQILMNILTTTSGPSRMARVQSLRLSSRGLISILNIGELQFSGRVVVLLLHRHCSLSQKGPQRRNHHIHQKRNARIVPSSPNKGAQHTPSRRHMPCLWELHHRA